MMNRKLNLSLDYGKARGNKGSVYMGAEYCPLPYLALRAGYAADHSESNGLRAGLGLHAGNVGFDYAFSQFGDLGMINRFELSLRFGTIRPVLTPEERKILRRGKQAMLQGRYEEAVLLFDSLIQMEPRYKPVRRLVKQAMRGNEAQEKLVKAANNFKYYPSKGTALGDDPALGDLEKLLGLDDSNVKSAKAGKR